jgi:hypothetical protein
MLQQAQEPPKPTIVISTQMLDESMELLRTDLNTSKILALQMMVNEIQDALPTIENMLATQQQLIARISILEQQAKEKEEQKKLKYEFKLQEHSRRILNDHRESQPIPQLIGENYRKDYKKNVNRYQSTISFKLVATSLVTTLVWWLWIYTH